MTDEQFERLIGALTNINETLSKIHDATAWIASYAEADNTGGVIATSIDDAVKKFLEPENRRPTHL